MTRRTHASIIAASVLAISLAGASASAFAASRAYSIPGDPGGFSPYASDDYAAGGNANLYYGGRGEMTPLEYRAEMWKDCTKVYPTFNTATGTFVGEDGLMHVCQ